MQNKGEKHKSATDCSTHAWKFLSWNVAILSVRMCEFVRLDTYSNNKIKFNFSCVFTLVRVNSVANRHRAASKTEKSQNMQKRSVIKARESDKVMQIL